MYEPEPRLKDDVLVPDLAAWRRERLPSAPSGEYPAVAPDWVCEVLSPSTAKIDRTKKLVIYAREKVCHAWLVDSFTANAGRLWTRNSALDAARGPSEQSQPELICAAASESARRPSARRGDESPHPRARV